MMRDVYIIGVGQSTFGKLSDRTAADLGLEAVSEATWRCRNSDSAGNPSLCGLSQYGLRCRDDSPNLF